MSFNLKGKFKYISGIIGCYPKWWQVFFNRLSDKPIRKIKLRNGLTTVGGEKSLIVDLIYEIFINEVYNPGFLKIKSGDTVVDIGANIGIFSLYAAKNGAAKILSVEPLPENIPLIKKNFHINNFKIPVIIERALTNKEGTARLYLGNIDSHNSLSDKNQNQKFNKYIFVKTIKLSTLLKKNKITKIDFLKIDCEGSEGQIIASTPADVWKNIEKVAIEYHNTASILNDHEIIKKLKSFGYKTKHQPSDNLIGFIYAWRK